ncbi:hypothetical protein EW145_g7563 [Phellinidium pouzarii]|uniref:Uncharacterized protein n=1 Tax=Phellinidium pouzarii TaxID=167371 RepID=A0A4S4KHE2_9AGAM|nr:hypothetical protein EW145_g7563 [Phellinidium pouzarii]
MTPYKGAVTQLYAATAPEIEKNGWRGEYFVPYAKRTQPSKLAMDEKLAEELWTFSENMVREKCGSLEIK